MNKRKKLEEELTDTKLDFLYIGFIDTAECLVFLNDRQMELASKEDDLTSITLLNSELQVREIIEKRRFLASLDLPIDYVSHYTGKSEGKYLLSLYYLYKEKYDVEKLERYHYRDLVFYEVFTAFLKNPFLVDYGETYDFAVNYLELFN
ncbi:MAG: hypothetical protein GY866_33560 [Proteobacteria bacterium]|nr:hypothetical protein [Pseudomonadota bacterium]